MPTPTYRTGSFAVIVTFDNTEPHVFGPYTSEADARSAGGPIGAIYEDDHHVQDVSVVPLRGIS